MKVNGPPSKIPPSAVQSSQAPPVSSLTTAIGLESEKQPCRSLAFAPISAPVISPSKLKCHTRQVPAPAPSKFTTSKDGGKPNIIPFSSVTTHCELAPEFPDSVIASAGILSSSPSPAQNSKGPPSSVPPSTSHGGPQQDNIDNSSISQALTKDPSGSVQYPSSSKLKTVSSVTVNSEMSVKSNSWRLQSLPVGISVCRNTSSPLAVTLTP